MKEKILIFLGVCYALIFQAQTPNIPLDQQMDSMFANLDLSAITTGHLLDRDLLHLVYVQRWNMKNTSRYLFLLLLFLNTCDEESAKSDYPNFFMDPLLQTFPLKIFTLKIEKWKFLTYFLSH